MLDTVNEFRYTFISNIAFQLPEYHFPSQNVVRYCYEVSVLNEAIWNAIVNCDERYDNKFLYGVMTTGIFCRPSCKSRTPNRTNVKIYENAEHAMQEGLRPCKRCRPDAPAARSSVNELADAAADVISNHYMDDLTLDQLARQMYVSPYYLQRIFKQATGVSPFAFLTEKRITEAKRLLLETDEPVTSIAFQVGFKNPSHFSVVFAKNVGVSPTQYRARQSVRIN